MAKGIIIILARFLKLDLDPCRPSRALLEPNRPPNRKTWFLWTAGVQCGGSNVKMLKVIVHWAALAKNSRHRCTKRIACKVGAVVGQL